MKLFTASVSIIAQDNKLPAEIHILPMGSFVKGNGFTITEQDCLTAISNFNKVKTELLIDYDHQSMWADARQGAVPAAGWVKELQYRQNEGVFATLYELTQTAEKHLLNKEYRYISPVFAFDGLDETGKNQGFTLYSIALTNQPFFDTSLKPFINNKNHYKEDKMDEEERKLVEAQKQTIADLQKANAGLTAQLQAMQKSELERTALSRIDSDIKANKLYPAQKEFALSVFKDNPENYENFIKCNVVTDLTANKTINPSKPNEALTFSKLKEDMKEYERVRKEDPELFNRLLDNHYNGGY